MMECDPSWLIRTGRCHTGYVAWLDADGNFITTPRDPVLIPEPPSLYPTSSMDGVYGAPRSGWLSLSAVLRRFVRLILRVGP
jgi:hypothetical protein